MLVIGPRQSGKTTLCREIPRSHGLRYLTLGELRTKRSAGRMRAPGVLRRVVRLRLN